VKGRGKVDWRITPGHWKAKSPPFISPDDAVAYCKSLGKDFTEEERAMRAGTMEEPSRGNEWIANRSNTHGWLYKTS
jgi:hypothetical protein